MARHVTMPFQLDRPVFIKVPQVRLGGRTYKRGEEYKWKEHGSADPHKVGILYTNGILMHNPEREIAIAAGDGLEGLQIEAMHSLVDNINKKVQAGTNTKTEFDRFKCKKSKVPDKQRGIIRSWRRNFGDRFEV